MEEELAGKVAQHLAKYHRNSYRVRKKGLVSGGQGDPLIVRELLNYYTRATGGYDDLEALEHTAGLNGIIRTNRDELLKIRSLIKEGAEAKEFATEIKKLYDEMRAAEALLEKIDGRS